MPEKSLAERQAEMRERMKNRPRDARMEEPVVVREKRTYTSEEIPPGFAPSIIERQGTFEISREDLYKLVVV